jgi:hypothetical protein
MYSNQDVFFAADIPMDKGEMFFVIHITAVITKLKFTTVGGNTGASDLFDDSPVDNETSDR